MSIKSAFVNNKLDYQVYLGDQVVERIYVHPNMIQLPRAGDKLVLTQLCSDAATATFGEAEPSVLNLEVLEVTIVHSVVRTRHNGALTTELLQQVQVLCREA